MKTKLSEEISKGIYAGFWKPLLNILLGIGIAGLVFILISLAIAYFSPPNLSQGQMSVSCGIYDRVECHVVNISNEFEFEREGFCGWQEADAWASNKHQQIKQDGNDSRLAIYCG